MYVGIVVGAYGLQKQIRYASRHILLLELTISCTMDVLCLPSDGALNMNVTDASSGSLRARLNKQGSTVHTINLLLEMCDN